MHSLLANKWTKVPVFALCLVPAGLLVWQGLHHGLGANPIERITHATGDWTLRFLIIALAVTPLRKVLRLPELIRFRRHVRSLCVFLWLPALHHLHLAR